MPPARNLIDEIDVYLNHCSAAQRSDTLQRITDLFVDSAKVFNEEHVHLFDEVMKRLIDQIETNALARLSGRLAPIDNAPLTVIHHLSRHDEVEVCKPVLELSNRLSDFDLTEIANTKGQNHLYAIAGRRRINSIITDVLLRRGNTEVAVKVADNSGALFSNEGFTRLVQRAEKEDQLADKIIVRSDIPPVLFKRLVSCATETVRQRLLANSDPETQERIKRILPAVSRQIAKKAHLPPMRQAGRAVKTALHQEQKRLKSQIIEFATAGKVQETIATLSALADIPIELIKLLIRQKAEDGILILCKAAGLEWPAAKAILDAGLNPWTPEKAEAGSHFVNYLRLPAENAQRVVRFMKARKTLSKEELNKLLNEHAVAPDSASQKIKPNGAA